MPPISEALRGSGGIELSYVSAKAKKVSTLRGPAQLADLQGALCVPTYNLTNGVVGRTAQLADLQGALCVPTYNLTETTATTKHAIHTHFSKESSRGKKTPNNAIRGQMHATTGFFRGYCLLTIIPPSRGVA